jgi:putative autotransporter adhesin-like protein
MERSIAIWLTGGLLIFSSCRKVIGEGPLVTQTRAVSNFTGVSFETSGNAYVTIGPAYEVEITAQQNILDVINSNVVSGVLHIDFKDNVRVREHEDVTVNISLPAADYFRLSGSGNMDVSGNVAANNLKLTLSGSGNINVQNAVVGDKIDAEVSGSGNISVGNGSAVNEDVDISGSGNIYLIGVSSYKTTTHISGSGDVKVVVSQWLDAHISGSGSVYYHGNPIISTSISGSGKVIPF